MKKKIATIAFLLVTMVTFSYGKKALKVSLKSSAPKATYFVKVGTNNSTINIKPTCRMTCSITVYDDLNERWTTIHETSGGLFTSCNTALENACHKLYEKVQYLFKAAEQ